MTELDALALVNRGLAEIGSSIAVDVIDRDLFTFGLTSIDRLLLVAKVEALSGRKIDIRKLGTGPHLTVSQLAEALI